VWGQRPGQAGISDFCTNGTGKGLFFFYLSTVIHKVFHNVGISTKNGKKSVLYKKTYKVKYRVTVEISTVFLFVNECSHALSDIVIIHMEKRWSFNIHRTYPQKTDLSTTGFLRRKSEVRG